MADQSALLAATVAKLTQRLLTIEQSLKEIKNTTLESEVKSLSEGVRELKEASRLPDGILFKSELSSELAARDSLINAQRIAVENHKRQISSDLHGAASGLREAVETMRVEHSERASALREQIEHIAATLPDAARADALLIVTEHVGKLAEDSDSRFKSILEQLTEAAKIESVTKLSEELAIVAQNLDALRTDAAAAIVNATNELRTELDSRITDTVDAEIERIGKILQAEVNERIQVTVELSNVINKAIEDALNRHDLTQEQITKIEDQLVTKIKDEIKAVKTDIKDVKKSIPAPVDLSGVKADIASLQNEHAALNNTLKNLPKPKDGKDGSDGKDAHEWEFKFSETVRGTLLWRRSDWKEWQAQNLIPQLPPLFGGMTAGGGISNIDAERIARRVMEEFEQGSLAVMQNGTPIAEGVNTINFIGATVEEVLPGVVNVTVTGGGPTTEENKILYVGNTAIASAPKIVVGQAVTDINGEFTFSFPTVGLSVSYSAKAIVVAAATAPNVDFEERMMHAFLTAESPTAVTGVVMRLQKFVEGTGIEQYAMTRVGAGVTVRVEVTGA